MSAALVSRGIDRVRIIRVDGYVGESGVLAYVQDFLPGLAAIGSAIEAAISTWRPQRSFGGNENCVAVFRADSNATNVLRVLQSQIGPALAAVFGFVNAVAVVNAALRVVLTCTYPHDRRIAGIEFHISDRKRSFVLEHRIPGEAVVVGLPHAA